MIIALNHKSNLTLPELEDYCQRLADLETNETIILCPTLLNLGIVVSGVLYLGSQNVSAYPDGAYTGEVSANQLQSYGIKYSIVGHSERRQYQKESNEVIHEKIKRLLEVDMIPILCIGETSSEREQNQVYNVLQEELSSAMKELTEEQKQKIIIAYEPIWSIGTGVIPTKEQIEEVFTWIKKDYPNNKVLYGGSANEENIMMLREIPLIDGYLLGGLSLKPEKLKEFLEKCK